MKKTVKIKKIWLPEKKSYFENTKIDLVKAVVFWYDTIEEVQEKKYTVCQQTTAL